MERREFFDAIISKPKYSNILTNENIEVKLSLEKYSGTWNYESASHLLRRSLFGFSDEKINKALNLGFEASIESLLNDDEAIPDPPVKFYPDSVADDGLDIGETFVDKNINFLAEPFRTLGVFSWWLENIRNQDFSLREKMTLFWHNHFATQLEVVRIGRFQYETNKLFRDHSIGNFKDLATKIAFDQTMMLFLNGNENISGRPNENYARELFELFTIGKGEQKGEGDYTNYTEKDVQEAAKVLTGWNFDYRNVQNGDYSVSFRSFIHDYSTKQFSSAFQNKVIQPTGEGEYYEMIDMIFDQEETSRFIVRELYKWFVFYKIDDKVEENIIQPLANILRENDFEVKPVLRTLLSSEHFFDNAFRGAMIKNPIDFYAGIIQSAKIDFNSLEFPGFDPISLKYYNYINNFYNRCRDAGMEIGNPPSVAGWEAYYQTPGYYRIWISSVTLPNRAEFTNTIFTQQGLRGDIPLTASSLEIVGDFEDAGYPDMLVDHLIKKMLPFDLDDQTKANLKLNLVLDGQGDYVWTGAWEDYKNNPENTLNRRSVQQKLNNLIISITNLSEYQLM